MALVKYLRQRGWLNDLTASGLGVSSEAALAELLDLEISVELAELVVFEQPPAPVDVAQIQGMVEPSLRLRNAVDAASSKYTLALANWDRGRYRIVQGARARQAFKREGFGTAAQANERWERVGRLIWASVLEFCETHFKRARMKVRVARQTFNGEAMIPDPSFQHLLALDEILLKAKLRQLDHASAWYARLAHQQFRKQMDQCRPALETAEALDALTQALSAEGWLRTFIDEFGSGYGLILSLECESTLLLSASLGFLKTPDAHI